MKAVTLYSSEEFLDDFDKFKLMFDAAWFILMVLRTTTKQHNFNNKEEL